MDQKTWAEFVVSLRENAGMTQKEFAVKTGVPIGTLRHWEQGLNTPNLAALRLVGYAIEKQGLDPEAILFRLGIV